MVIAGGTVVDGTGNPAFRANVGIRAGRIVAISRTPLPGDRTVDAAGMVVAPGFIDPHSHSDSTLLAHPNALTSLRQGITTAAVGNCGLSPAPLADWYRPRVEAWLSNASGEAVEAPWAGFGEWLETLEGWGVGINVVPFVGHNTVRALAMGVERAQRPEEREGGRRRVPTSEELERMCRLVRQSMEQGAFGLTTGLEYPPGRNALTDELAELCRVAAQFGGVHLSHPRGMGDTVIEATREVIEVTRRAGIPGNVAHLKAMGRENWGRQVAGALSLIEKARAEGLEVTCDVYPYDYSAISNLSRHLLGPSFAHNEGASRAQMEAMLAALRDDEEFSRLATRVEERAREEIEDNRRRMEEDAAYGITTPNVWSYGGYPFLTIVHSPSFPELAGRSLADIGGLWATDSLRAAREILLADEGLTRVTGGPMSEEDVRAVLVHPTSMVSTDGSALDRFPEPEEGLPHPRGIASYPRVLQRYVRQEGLLSLEQAVRKMTSLPAQVLGLPDRGLIRRGMSADLVVFHPGRVCESSTYGDPCRFPAGIEYVLVNGSVAVDGGEPTGVRAGQVLRRG